MGEGRSGAGLGGADYPEAGIDVGEDAVALFDFGQTRLLGFSDCAGCFEGLPESFDFVELIVVGEEADLGVVAGGAGGYEELPVGGFEEEELAAELLHDAKAEVGGAPKGGGADVASVDLGRVDVGVGPTGIGVEPDLVVALRSPGAFVHGDEAGAGVLVEVVGAADELDSGLVIVKVAGDGFEPEGALEPPVAEELCVEGGAEDGRDGVVEAGLQSLVDKMDEVGGVGLDALGCFLRVVGLLVVHVDPWAGDAPVAMPAGPAFFMEVEVDAVAGVAGVSGPDLEAGVGIAGKDGSGVLFGVGAVDVVGLVEGAVGLVGETLVFRALRFLVAGRIVGRGGVSGLFDQMSVYEEELEAGLGESLLDADAMEGWGRG